MMFLFGRRLKELRKSAKMTQEELGSKINVTKVSICCYENGTRIPSLETLIDLSNLFNVTLDYLIGHDTYVIAEENNNYGVRMATGEIEVVKELRRHSELYKMVIDEPKRMLDLIDKKVR